MSNSRLLQTSHILSLLGFTGNLGGEITYGVAGAIESVGALARGPLALATPESSFFNSFPVLVECTSIVNISSNLLYIFDRLSSESENKVSECFLPVIKIATNSLILAASIYGTKYHAVMGMAAFGFLCDTIALRSIISLLCCCKQYRDASSALYSATQINPDPSNIEKYQKSYDFWKLQLIYNALLTIGWITLALAHVGALAAASPVLVAVGSTIVGAVGVKCLYDFCCRIKAENAKGKEDPRSSTSSPKSKNS